MCNIDPKLYRCLITLCGVMGTCVLPRTAWSVPTEVTSRSALGGNDWINWGQFPLSDNDARVWLPNPLMAVSNFGLPVNVTQYDALHQKFNPTSHFYRFLQGDGNTYFGNFAPGDPVLDNGEEYTFDAGPTTLTFPQGMAGVGAQIQAGNSGPFTAEIQAYDQHGALLAAYDEIGNSTNGNDGSAIFLGIDDPDARIYQISYSLTAASFNNVDSFSINDVSLVTVPEPAVAGLIALAICRPSLRLRRVKRPRGRV